jgi:hypothetical protein
MKHLPLRQPQSAKDLYYTLSLRNGFNIRTTRCHAHSHACRAFTSFHNLTSRHTMSAPESIAHHSLTVPAPAKDTAMDTDCCAGRDHDLEANHVHPDRADPKR